MVRSPVGPWSLVFAVAIVAVSHAATEKGFWKKISRGLSPPQWGFSYATLLVLIFLMRTGVQKAFIYFQF
jgi:hypothetical protein